MSSLRSWTPRRRASARRRGARSFVLVFASACFVCLVLGARVVRAEEAPIPEPVRLGTEESGVEVLVYPPRDRSAPRPVTVMLHGMCDEPEHECPYFAAAVTRESWLVCPRASLRCPNGGSIWSYQVRHHTVERAVTLVRTTFAGELDEAPGRTLIGFSLGALFGMDVGHRANGRYPRLLLIGAKVEPQAPLLRREGVERVIFAAGDFDMMSGHMREQAHRLDRKGVATRFESLGRIGHRFPADLEQRLEGMLQWLHHAE
ncbi:MAG: hypothetical protein JW751_23785 [Polyangiaceae bacterium]|nr:hypothetical protein [Polyangiaceae bacterium]